jgi:small subunit ribosomal protein S11
MNNIVVSVSTLDGNVVSRCSGGVLGLRHRARASPAAGTDIARAAAQKAFERGFRVAHVHLKGPSRARGQVLRGLQAGGLKVADIRDVTPVPTNGCRPKAARRL